MKNYIKSLVVLSVSAVAATMFLAVSNIDFQGHLLPSTDGQPSNIAVAKSDSTTIEASLKVVNHDENAQSVKPSLKETKLESPKYINKTPNSYQDKNINLSQDGDIVSYSNKAVDYDNAETVSGKIYRVTADREKAPLLESDTDQKATSVDYMIETKDGTYNLDIEQLDLSSTGDFEGQVVKSASSDSLMVANAKITMEAPIAATPAIKNHRYQILQISSGGTGIATTTQITNIANSAAQYWKANSNGTISNFTVDPIKSVSRSDICSMTDNDIFALLGTQFGYSSFQDIKDRNNSGTITTLVVFIPNSCSKPYAGMAMVGDGINDSGIIILKNSVGGILTDSNGNSTLNNTYIDQAGAYNRASLTHETGHTFGLGHSGSYNTTNRWKAYDDFYSVMGGGYNTYVVPKLDGYYKDWLGLSDSTNNEKVGVALNNANKIATTLHVNPIDSSTVASRYLKIYSPTLGRSYYIEYRSGNLNDKGAFYNEISNYHISNAYFCSEPGITLATEADGFPGVTNGSGGSVSGRPDVLVQAQDSKTVYDSFNTNAAYQCYHNYFTGSIILPGVFNLHVYSLNSTNGMDVKVEPLDNPYSDISTYEFSNYILWMYKNGISGGYPNYHPNDILTRGQMAAFIYRLAGKPAFTPTAAELTYYTDVNYAEFRNEILWMARVGITTTRGYYGTNDAVTRGQMAAFMYRLAGKPAFTPTAAELTYYTDVNSTEFRDAILWMARTGITTTRGRYGTYDPITRGSMAAFMYRLNDKVTHYVYY